MAVAGKVAITPKGEWNANTAYTKLDLVFYDNASYVAIQPSTGVIPTDESYWMLVVQSAGGADFEGIINGDIQVGNAKTLDGHKADYFVAKDGSVPLDRLLTIGASNTDKYVALLLKNLNRSLEFGITQAGAIQLHDATNKKNIFTSGADGTNTFNGTASGNLPLTGGRLSGTAGTVLSLENTAAAASFLQFLGKHGVSGYVGFDYADHLIFKKSDSATTHAILHTGNGATYEEGTFDLTLEGRTLSGYKYTKIGKFVYLSGTVPFDGEPLTIENTTVEVHGLPFEISSVSYIYFGDAIYTPSNKATDNLVNYVSGGTYFGIGGGGTTSFAVGTPCVLHAMYITD